MPRQVRRGSRRAVATQVVRARAIHAARRADRHGDERGVAQPPDAHRHVDRFLQQVDDPVEEQKVDLHRRMPGEELVGRGRYVEAAEQDRRRDAQPALRRDSAGRERRFRLFHAGQQPLAALEVFAALVGERKAARGAVEQAHVELLLERGERAHHRRERGPAIPPRRSGCHARRCARKPAWRAAVHRWDIILKTQQSCARDAIYCIARPVRRV